MIEQMENAGDDAIIGSAFDGFPKYGDKNPDGTEIAEGNLGIGTGQPDDTFCYRFPTTPDAFQVVLCLIGVVTEFDWRSLVRSLPAALWFGGQPQVVVAVTGTNGKTTAANLGTTGIEGAYAAPLGHTTPEPVTLQRHLAAMAKAGVTHLAMEASSFDASLSQGILGQGLVEAQIGNKALQPAPPGPRTDGGMTIKLYAVGDGHVRSIGFFVIAGQVSDDTEQGPCSATWRMSNGGPGIEAATPSCFEACYATIGFAPVSLVVRSAKRPRDTTSAAANASGSCSGGSRAFGLSQRGTTELRKHSHPLSPRPSSTGYEA